jgi:HAMP domain-containing protein
MLYIAALTGLASPRLTDPRIKARDQKVQSDRLSNPLFSSDAPQEGTMTNTTATAYTVRLSQPIEDLVQRQEIAVRIGPRLKLSPEMAEKALGKRGNILKPTLLEKAAKFAEILESAGVQVELIAVPAAGSEAAASSSVSGVVAPSIAPTPAAMPPISSATPIQNPEPVPSPLESLLQPALEPAGPPVTEANLPASPEVGPEVGPIPSPELDVNVRQGLDDLMQELESRSSAIKPAPAKDLPAIPMPQMDVSVLPEAFRLEAQQAQSTDWDDSRSAASAKPVGRPQNLTLELDSMDLRYLDESEQMLPEDDDYGVPIPLETAKLTLEEDFSRKPAGWLSLRWKLLPLVLVPVLALGAGWLTTTLLQSRASQALALRSTYQTARVFARSALDGAAVSAGGIATAQTATALENKVMDLYASRSLPLAWVSITDAKGKTVAVYGQAIEAQPAAKLEPVKTFRSLAPEELAASESLGASSVGFGLGDGSDLATSPNDENPVARSLNLGSGSYYLISHPLENKLGAVQFAVSSNEIDGPTRTNLLATLAVLGVVLGLVAAIASLVIQSLSRRIVDLAATADRISLGNLDERIYSSTKDEIGDLAASLERMRHSLESAMRRIRRKR